MALLRHHEDDLRGLRVQVLAISFSADHWARAWLQDTGAPFPLLMDPERATYGAYGLGSSFLRVWSPTVMLHYTRRVLAGQRLLPIQGDPHQMGGDFIVDAAGTVRLAHCSKDPTDRPSVGSLLMALQAIGTGSRP